MEYTKLKCINQYKSESINPAKTPDTVFEMYSVPIYETGHPEYLRGDEIASNKAVVQKNDILLCKINPRINRVWVVSDESDKMNIASSEWIVIRNSEYNPEFLAWYFRTPKFQKLMTSEVTGIGGSLTRAQPKCVAEYPVPVLDRVKQDEIVDILNKCKFVIESRKQELTALDDLIKARFVELFGNPITNDRGWEVAELNTVCDGIGDGLHGTPEYDEDGEYPFINGNNLMDGVIKVTPATKMVNEDTYKKHFIELTDNAILLSINGTLGKLAFYNGEEVMLGKSACYCNLKPEINREFVYGVMKTDAFAGFLESNATASTIKNVGLKAIRGFKLILPPEELQFQFIEFANQVDKSKVAVQKALDETQLLFDSLMQEYFG